jgi:hypothetical protein
MKALLLVLSRADRNSILKLGANEAFKDTLVEILRRVGIAHEVAAEIAGLSDDAVNDRLQNSVRPSPGFLLPSGGTDNVPTGGTAGSTKGADS